MTENQTTTTFLHPNPPLPPKLQVNLQVAPHPKMESPRRKWSNGPNSAGPLASVRVRLQKIKRKEPCSTIRPSSRASWTISSMVVRIAMHSAVDGTITEPSHRLVPQYSRHHLRLPLVMAGSHLGGWLRLDLPHNGHLWQLLSYQHQTSEAQFQRRHHPRNGQSPTRNRHREP